MNIYYLTAYSYFEGVEEDRTLGCFPTLRRAFEVAAADELARSKHEFNTPSYAIEEWHFVDTYAPPEQKPDGVRIATYNGHDARGGRWTLATKDEHGVWETKPFKAEAAG